MRPYNVYLRKDHSWQFTSLSGPKKGSSNFLIWIGGCQNLCLTKTFSSKAILSNNSLNVGFSPNIMEEHMLL